MSVLNTKLDKLKALYKKKKFNLYIELFSNIEEIVTEKNNCAWSDNSETCDATSVIINRACKVKVFREAAKQNCGSRKQNENFLKTLKTSLKTSTCLLSDKML